MPETVCRRNHENADGRAAGGDRCAPVVDAGEGGVVHHGLVGEGSTKEPPGRTARKMKRPVLMRCVKGHLIPLDDTERELMGNPSADEVLSVSIKRARNVKFHRKYFAMMNLAFESWEPPMPEFRGLPAQKNFDRFRSDVTVAAGFFTAVVNLKGEVRAEPKSIAFSSMTETEFGKLYDATATVLIERVLKNYTRADLDRVVEELMGFM